MPSNLSRSTHTMGRTPRVNVRCASLRLRYPHAKVVRSSSGAADRTFGGYLQRDSKIGGRKAGTSILPCRWEKRHPGHDVCTLVRRRAPLRCSVFRTGSSLGRRDLHHSAALLRSFLILSRSNACRGPAFVPPFPDIQATAGVVLGRSSRSLLANARPFTRHVARESGGDAGGHPGFFHGCSPGRRDTSEAAAGNSYS